MMSYWRALALGFVVVLAPSPAAAQSDTIDFETTPDGQVPVDNSNLTASYTFSFGTVSMYFLNSSGIKVPPKFEATGTDPEYGFLDSANRQDRPAGGDLGAWFLRQAVTGSVPPVFYVEYGSLSRPIDALSGEIWDIDGRAGGAFEQWEVSVLDDAGAVVATTLSPKGVLYTDPASLDALPWTFSFQGLAATSTRVQKLRIRYVGNVTDVGLAFNNFRPAAGAAAAVSAYGSYTAGLLGALASMLLCVGLLTTVRRPVRSTRPGS